MQQDLRDLYARYGLEPVKPEDIDPKKHTIIDGEFQVLRQPFVGAHDGVEDKPLYYERDGILDRLRPVYADKPPGKSWTV